MENELLEKKGEFFKQFISDWKRVLLKPKDFFAETTMEYGKAIKFAAVNILVYSIGAVLVGQALGGKFALVDNLLLSFLYVFVSILLALFVTGLIFHCFFKIFGGKGSYKESLAIRAYSYVVLAFSWIPILGIIANIYGLYIVIRGGEIKHNLSLGKSIAAVILSTIIPALLAIALFATSLGMLKTISG